LSFAKYCCGVASAVALYDADTVKFTLFVPELYMFEARDVVLFVVISYEINPAFASGVTSWSEHEASAIAASAVQTDM
jgi:hypothetical protein